MIEETVHIRLRARYQRRCDRYHYTWYTKVNDGGWAYSGTHVVDAEFWAQMEPKLIAAGVELLEDAR